MTHETRTTVLNALRVYRGDNYERARIAFARLSSAQMQEQYGHSGQTCQEVLDGYGRHAETIDRAINEIAQDMNREG